MKLRKLLFFSAITVGLIACNDDDLPNPAGGETDASISIKVYPAGNSSQTRATGDLSGNPLDAESKIHKLEAWIFNGNALEQYATSTTEEIKKIKATSGPRTLVVVANASIGTQSTLTALIASTKDLSQNIETGLVMTTEPLGITLVKGENFYGYDGKTEPGKKNFISSKPLALTRINARVAVVSASVDLKKGQTHVFDALTEVQVTLFNVPKTSKLFGKSLSINENYLYGQKWLSTSGSYSEGALDETLFTGITTFPIEKKAAPYYYVNENTASPKAEQLLIVLRGKPTLGGNIVLSPGLYTDAEGYTYYPVWVNAHGYEYSAGHTADSKIIRNTQYNISLIITGIGNPSIDGAEEAFLDVKVEVAPWKVVDQTVTW